MHAYALLYARMDGWMDGWADCRSSVVRHDSGLVGLIDIGEYVRMFHKDLGTHGYCRPRIFVRVVIVGGRAEVEWVGDDIDVSFVCWRGGGWMLRWGLWDERRAGDGDENWGQNRFELSSMEEWNIGSFTRAVVKITCHWSIYVHPSASSSISNHLS